MGNYASIDRTEWIRNLSVHLADRADVTPWMTAVRIGDDSVTFGDLVHSFDGYRRVLDAERMSVESAITAAVMHSVPGLGSLGVNDLGSSMSEIVQWLGRDLPAKHAGLRSVG